VSDERTFTLPEAQALLPVLESLLKSAIASKKRMEEVQAEMQQLSGRIFLLGGVRVDLPAVTRRKAEGEKAAHRLKDTLDEISATGVQVKDLDVGLLDFPCRVDGEIILLCWKLGESAIEHWHGVSEGFAGRKPIDDKIRSA